MESKSSKHKVGVRDMSYNTVPEMEQGCRCLKFVLCLASLSLVSAHVIGYGEQPLSKIAIQMTTTALRKSVSIQANPVVLGLQVHWQKSTQVSSGKIQKACAFHKGVENS